MIHKIRNKRITLIDEKMLFIILLIVHSALIPFLNIPLLTDEVNPLASLFIFRGNDWRQYMISDGYYYKYGELPIYALFLWIKKPTILYKALLFENAVMLSCIAVIVHKVALLMDENNSPVKSWLLALTVGLLPIVTLDGKMSWSEPLQMLISWLLVWQLLELNRKNSGGTIRSVLVILLAGYAYMIHTRGIIILASTILMMFFFRFIWKKNQVKLMLPLLALFAILFLDACIGDYFKSYIYGYRDNLAGGTINFLPNFFEHVLTSKGVGLYITELLGWTFSYAIASFGLGMMGIIFSVNLIYNSLSKRKDDSLTICCIWGMLLFGGSLFMGTIFFFEDIWKYSDGIVLNRGDKLIYPRYLEIASVILTFVALYVLLYKGVHKLDIFFSLIILNFLCFYFMYRISWKIEETTTWTNILMTVSYFMDFSGVIRGGAYSKVGGLTRGMLLLSFVSQILILLIGWLKLKEKWKIMLGILLFTFFMCYIQAFFNVRYRQDQYVKDVIETYRNIVCETEEISKYKKIYLDDEIIRMAMQFAFYDFDIYTRRNRDVDSVENMFVLSFKDEYNHDLYNHDYYEIEGIKNMREYHIYIKGKELNDYMKNKNYTTAEVEL